MKISLLFLLLLLFGLMSCLIGSNDDVTVVNGIRLEYENTTTIEQLYEQDTLIIDTGSGNVKLNGVPGKSLKLEVAFMEYEPGDASIVISNNELSYDTKSGKPAMIMSVSGTIPQHLALDIDTGSGDVSLNDMQDSPMISIDSGSGNVSISKTAVSNLFADTGSGNVEIDHSVANTFEADTGSGNVSLSDSRILNANIDTGSGDIHLLRSEIRNRQFDTGSGDVIEVGPIPSSAL